MIQKNVPVAGVWTFVEGGSTLCSWAEGLSQLGPIRHYRPIYHKDHSGVSGAHCQGHRLLYDFPDSRVLENLLLTLLVDLVDDIDGEEAMNEKPSS